MYRIFSFNWLLSCLYKIVISVKLSESVLEGEQAALTLQFVKGGVGNIPCNVSLNQFEDEVQTVIWYKEIDKNNPTPIYTYDVRDKEIENGEHWSDHKILASRGSFRYQDEPAKLVITNLKETDAGIYHCRVDFKKGPTLNIEINVEITVSPEKIILMDDVSGGYIDNYVLGPYSEGDSVNVTCIALGGRPKPNVTWWKENAILDDVSEIATRKRVKNTLYLNHLDRTDVHAVYTCQASNNNNVPPLTAAVTLDIYLRPLWAKIWGKQRVLSAGNTYEISCEVIGSRPRPLITWWLESVQLVNTRELSNAVNYSSTSFLTFKPSMEQDNQIITCNGVHPIFNATVEDSWKLKIHYVPLSTLAFDSAVNRSDIREGMDVMLHCGITANPWVYTVNWKYNDKAIYNNPEMGTIITNQSLLIKNLSRSNSGNFTCVGTNLEGIGESNVLRLDVKYAAVCRPGQTTIYRTSVQNRVEIRCELEANPPDVEFTWKFKYNDGNIVNLPENFITSEGTVSTIYYTPSSDDDFPTLICNGKNSIGETEDACIFHLLPIDLPEAPSNCKVTKQTESSLHVECIDEFNRGIRGEFIMEVYDAQTGKLVRNVTSKHPTFVVGELESGIGFDIDLYVLNKDGKSLVTRLPTFTLNNDQAANLLLLPSITTLLGMLAGVVGVLILLAVIIVVVIRSRTPKGCNDFDDNEFQDSSGRYMSMRSSKLTNKTDSNSYDSFDTDSRDVTL
ncbi:nephrin-like [Photinus pyralis]|uniref:nephrin-like n=1 Tax=Photinus pyralis TaxID=7054 RepID=UPI001266F3E0|nr:nephrin-like [Photinus pyralis]